MAGRKLKCKMFTWPSNDVIHVHIGPPSESVDGLTSRVWNTWGLWGEKQMVIGWTLKYKLLKQFLDRTRIAALGVRRPGTQLCRKYMVEACRHVLFTRHPL